MMMTMMMIIAIVMMMMMMFMVMMRDLTVTGIILFDCPFLDVAYHSICHLSKNIIMIMEIVMIQQDRHDPA